MRDQNSTPIPTQASHYLRTGKILPAEYFANQKSVRQPSKAIRTVRNKPEKIIVIGGRHVTIVVQNFQIFAAPLRVTLASFPLDVDGQRMTAFQNNSTPFLGLLPPAFKRTFKFDAGPLGASYRHVLIVEPDTNATGAGIIVNVTLEARH